MTSCDDFESTARELYQPSMMNLCSITSNLPTKRKPIQGLFVDRRLSAMSKISCLTSLLASPWFPWLRPIEQPAKGLTYPTHGIRVPYIPVLFKKLDRLWFRRALHPIIDKLHQQQNFHALDAHFGYPVGAAVCDVGTYLGIPSFVTVRGVEQPQLKSPIYKRHLQDCFHQARGIIAVSHSLKNSVVAAGVSPNKISVIPNAVDTQLFFPSDKNQAKRKINYHPDGPLIVSAGTLRSVKGFHDLLPAFAKVLTTYRNANLVIIGSHGGFELTYQTKLKEQIDQLGIGKHVTLTGSLPPKQVAKWFRAADLFALATYREGCCNVVLEALASGTPVVTTPAGDNSIYVKHGKNGFIHQYGEIEEITQRINEGLGTNWDHAKLAKDVSEYRWEDVADRVTSFMQEKI